MDRFIRLAGPLLLLLAVGFLMRYPTVAASHTPAADASSAAGARTAPEEAPAPGWDTLRAAVETEAATFPGRLSVLAVDLRSGERFAFAPDERYHPASTMKVAIAICAAQAVERGDLTWETPVLYTPADYDPDEPTDLADMPFDTPSTVRELVDAALTFSSNVAMQMLTRTLTTDGLLACTQALGGPVTRGPAGSTPVTVADVTAWWQALWDLHQTEPARAEVLLSALRAATYTGRIAAGTPEHDLVTHKFGSVDDSFHDGAIVWAERPYILVVLTAGAGEGEADAAIERIAAAAWAAREKGPGAAAPGSMTVIAGPAGPA